MYRYDGIFDTIKIKENKNNKNTMISHGFILFLLFAGKINKHGFWHKKIHSQNALSYMNIYDFKPNDQSHGHILEKLIIMIKVKMSSEAPALEEPTRFGQLAVALGAAVQLVRIHIRDIIRDMIRDRLESSYIPSY